MIKVPQNLTRLDVVWGNVKHLPKWDSIPEEFRKNWTSNKYCKVAEDWFYGLLKKLPDVKQGLDRDKVHTALVSILRSFEPKHEHKIAGVGYLISEWCIIDD